MNVCTENVRSDISMWLFVVVVFTIVFVFMPQAVSAANLNSISFVRHGGATIAEGNVVTLDDISSVTDFWVPNFNWPHPVSNAKAFIAIAKGTFGNLDGGVPQEYVNFGSTYQAWYLGDVSVVVSTDFASLGDISTPSGTYTVILAELGSNFDTNGTMEWFASGGVSGTEPVNYSLMTFEYLAESHPVQLDTNDVFNWARYRGHTMTPDDNIVYREDFDPLSSSREGFWILSFNWPNDVKNLQASFFLFRGTFGNLDGGEAEEFVNHAGNLHQWWAGSVVDAVHLPLPSLHATSTPPGIYTIMIAERDPKYVPSSLSQEADWFASGGTSGVGPIKYALLEIDFRKYHDCCSSLVFLPGIKGSVLKLGSNTLWPPSIWSDDMEKLALTASGESENSIVVGGVLETFYGTSIYGGFTSFLDDIVASGTIKNWLPVAYDWRFSPEKILSDGVTNSVRTINVVDDIKKLAENSQTGQVTLVAHSMGGFLGKAIIKKLVDGGRGDLVDSFVMVGTPQLGTPQAVASLLHGDDEGIAGGLIVDRSVARSIAQNFQSAYDLLPSPAYFAQVNDPVIVFDTDALFTQGWHDYWGLAINNFVEFFSFAIGDGVVRTDPILDELNIPEILRSDLLQNSVDFHNEYDEFVFPGSVRVVQVAGWGVPTLKGIEYKDRHFSPGYDTISTIEGDKTVLYSSAVSSIDDERYFFNLERFRIEGERGTQHRSLLNTEPIQNIIKKVVDRENIFTTQYISSIKPDPVSIADKLLVSTHSPVILGVYDENNNFTGIDPNQDLSSDILFISESIPGSTFIVRGESQYVFLPKDGIYDFVFRGVGEGLATVEVEEFSNDVSTFISSYSDIPVTVETKAMFSVDSLTPESFAIGVDSNSDGVIDFIVSADNTELTLEEVIVLLKAKIESLYIKDNFKKKLLKKITKIERKIGKSQEKNVSKLIAKFINKISKYEGELSEADIEEIMVLLEEMESKL